MDKREKTQRQQDEDRALNKVLLWMVGAAVLVAALRWLQRVYIDYATTDVAIDLAWNISRVLPWLSAAGFLLAAAAFLWAFRGRRAGKRVLIPGVVGIFLTALALCTSLTWRFHAGGIQMATYIVIGVAVLAGIYYLYQRDFALVGLACGLGLAGLWLLFRSGKNTRFYVVLAVLLLALAALAAVARYLQKADGMLAGQKGSIELLPKGTNYLLIYLTCAIIATLLVVALVVGVGAISAMAYYAVPVAWLLIMAVYYTVKLM